MQLRHRGTQPVSTHIGPWLFRQPSCPGAGGRILRSSIRWPLIASSQPCLSTLPSTGANSAVDMRKVAKPGMQATALDERSADAVTRMAMTGFCSVPSAGNKTGTSDHDDRRKAQDNDHRHYRALSTVRHSKGAWGMSALWLRTTIHPSSPDIRDQPSLKFRVPLEPLTTAGAQWFPLYTACLAVH